MVLHPQLKRGDLRDSSGNVRFGMIAAKSAAISILNNAEHGGFGRRLSGIGALSRGKGTSAEFKDQCKTIQQVCRLRCR